MSDDIRILIVEDLPDDAELIERVLRGSIPNSDFLRVDARPAYVEALASFAPHLILCDYRLPEFDGMSALELAVKACPETPFIVVTGSISEDTAVECMKLGAWDYVIKDHIKRLVPAVTSAFEQKRIRVARRHAEDALRESEARFATAFQRSPVSMAITSGSTGEYIEVNETFLRESGYCREEVIGHTWDELEIFSEPADRERLVAQATEAGRSYCLEVRLRMKHGQILDTLVSTQLILLCGAPHFLSTIVDITARKKAELQLSTQVAELQRWQSAMLGREGRVQELKYEVNALCRRLGEPLRYASQDDPK